MPPGPPKPPGAICAHAAARRQQQQRGGGDARTEQAHGSRSPARTPLVGAQLEQHAAGGGGMQERDLVAARARAGGLVDQADAGRLERRQRGGQVFDLEADVVQAGAAAGEETRQAALPRGRADFEGGAVVVGGRRRPAMQEGDVGRLAGDVLARARRQAEQRGQVCARAASRSATAMAT